MKKVIVKAKLRSRESFEKKLNDIDMKFSDVIWQHERIYVPKGFKLGMNLPRMMMRTEMKAVDKPAKYELILKRHIEDSGVDVVDATVVKDYVETVNIIHQLGFKKIAEVSRKRQEIDMGDGVKMYLDKVENVAGSFVKLESVVEEKEKVSDVFYDLSRTLKVLGEDDFVEKPYFELF